MPLKLARAPFPAAFTIAWSRQALGRTIGLLALGSGIAACGGSAAAPPAAQEVAAGATYRVFAVNDLGMHCMDREFSVFGILPPFNVVQAQVLKRPPAGPPSLVDANVVRVTYSGVADRTGSVNTVSLPKTDFWTYANALFGTSLAPGEGLTGLYMPKDAPVPGPQSFTWDAVRGVFVAFGIPITPFDDSGATNPYPLLRMRAVRNSDGAALAFTDAVVPVSSEMDCNQCHVTGGIAADDPGIQWSNTPDLDVQTKENVLILHDAVQGTQLFAQQPVLCASCHYSAALDLAGSGPGGSQIGNPTMSEAMHRYHGELTDEQGLPIFPPGGTPEQTCYKCHPGLITQCQRGVMKDPGGMDCRSCHGDMLAVGGAYPLLPGGSIDGTNDGQPRRPWLDLPRCQSCHTGDAVSHLTGANLEFAPDGIRLQLAWRNGDPSASPLRAANQRFAENTDTLYRFSKGHGGLLCESCHGSTHAEWPNADPLANDNVPALQLQRHSGPIIECKACHAPGTIGNPEGGPHGLHTVGDQHWVEHHGEAYEHNEQSCRACHGTDLRGTPLAATAVRRSFRVEDHTVTLPKDTPVACDICHELPN